MFKIEKGQDGIKVKTDVKEERAITVVLCVICYTVIQTCNKTLKEKG